MKKSLHLELSKYKPTPKSLRGACVWQTKESVDVDLAGLYHHYYLDNHGIEPPSPDPAHFEYLRFLRPSEEFRFQGDGLGVSTSARRCMSSQMGQAFCRWFMHEHLGIKYFAHIGSLIGANKSAFHGFAVERSAFGDTPDYLCSGGLGSVVVAEAKGRYTPISFKSKEFESWRQQFTRVRVLDGTGTAVSVKGHIVATRFATEYQARVQSKLYAEDPRTEGQEPISQLTASLLSRQIAASHYADVLLKLDQPYMSISLRNLVPIAEEIRIMATLWEFDFGGQRMMFVGGYHSGAVTKPLVELVDNQIVRHRSDPFKLGAHNGTFIGLELSVFKHLVSVCRGANRLLENAVPEIRPLVAVYSGLSMLQGGSVIGPLQLFNPYSLATF